MARGGINKVLVKKARDSVLGKGENPSIDAVRVELGNTGSKSTIHRYLKEIEEEASTRLDDAALLSQPIKELIGRLASTLHQEANAIVSDSKDQFQSQLSDVRAQLKLANDSLSASETQLALSQDELDSGKQHNIELENQIQTTRGKLQEMGQRTQSLENIITEKDGRIDSLEEKHTHSREALEHYRDSVKTQREQDAAKHDQQIQQTQAEIRQLNQSLSVKQTDITLLNKDNSRLVTELREVRKLESALQTSNINCKTAEEALAVLKSQLDQQSSKESSLLSDNQTLETKIDDLVKEVASLTVQNAKQEAEILIKDKMIDRMMPIKSETIKQD